MTHHNLRGKNASVLVTIQRSPIKPDRSAAIEALQGRKFAYFAPKVSFNGWQELVKSYTFVICPHGHGLDTHRLWEVLLIGSIPVVKTSTLDEMFIGLPVVVVQNWEDVTETMLQDWLENFQEVRLDKIFFPFWQSYIQKAQSEALTLFPLSP